MRTLIFLWEWFSIFCVQENNKNPNEISKLGLSPRAPTKKTKSKQQLSYTAQQLNDKNKGEVPSAAVNAQTQMALLQRQSAGKLLLCFYSLDSARILRIVTLNWEAIL